MTQAIARHNPITAQKPAFKFLMIGLQIASAGIAIAAPAGAQGLKQTSQDEYTLYELLAPDTASFKIDYEVTATTPGARLFWNPIRKGSVASDEAVFDV